MIFRILLERYRAFLPPFLNLCFWTQIVPNLVVPRAHDYITLLLGLKEKYSNYMAQHPGTYFRSTGWFERNMPEIREDSRPKSITTQLGLNRTFQEYVEKFGEDNARYLMEVLNGTKHYDTIAYIKLHSDNNFTPSSYPRLTPKQEYG